MTPQVPQIRATRPMSGRPVSLPWTPLPESVCARCAHAPGLLGWLEEALQPLPFAMCFSAAEELPGGRTNPLRFTRLPKVSCVAGSPMQRAPRLAGFRCPRHPCPANG